MIKKIGYGILILLVAYLLYHYKSVIYGVQQGAGQVKVLLEAQEIADLMADPNFPDSVKEKFTYISTIKDFAEKELGLTPTENYTTFFDQKGKPILWVVTASPEFKVEAYEWEFPIAGGFPYKGFWDIEKAQKEEQKMKDRGFDTEIDEVNAWSTLGWFKDPVLSSMLKDGPARLAELIIHESTHATLYVKDSARFNENLASFVGKKGAELFLTHHFGAESKELNNYIALNERRGIYKNYMRESINQLKTNYETLNDQLSLDEKRAKKKQWIDAIKEGMFGLYFDSAQHDYQKDSVKLRARLDTLVFNNAYFSGFSTYSKELPKLQGQLDKEFNGNLKEMIVYFKNTYESL